MFAPFGAAHCQRLLSQGHAALKIATLCAVVTTLMSQAQFKQVYAVLDNACCGGVPPD